MRIYNAEGYVAEYSTGDHFIHSKRFSTHGKARNWARKGVASGAPGKAYGGVRATFANSTGAVTDSYANYLGKVVRVNR